MGAFEALTTETEALYDYGRDQGSNVHLVAMIALSRKLLGAASTVDERGAAYVWLGNALQTLGSRESGTVRLEEAVAAYRAALEETTRERVPLQWARTQTNLGNALRTLGERESGTARLEEAVAAYRAALEETTRERVPLDWARTQMNLGNALLRHGERESGTGKLAAAVAAYREALKEYTPQTHPANYQHTMENLNQAIALLKKKGLEKGSVR